MLLFAEASCFENNRSLFAFVSRVAKRRPEKASKPATGAEDVATDARDRPCVVYRFVRVLSIMLLLNVETFYFENNRSMFAFVAQVAKPRPASKCLQNLQTELQQPLK